MAPDTDRSESSPDVMISYAHADSKSIAKELYQELTAYGLEVWYDDVELDLGDDIRESIDKALSESDHAVLIISPSYFEGMSQFELGGVVQMHNNSDDNVLIPVLHKMSFEELREESPTLAGTIGIQITEDNVDEVTAEIFSSIDSAGTNTGGSLSNQSDDAKRVDVDVTLEDLADISKGSKVTVNEWRTEGTPHDRGIRAVKMTVEDNGLTYSGANFVGTTRVVKDEPLEGYVSGISEKSAGNTEFSLRIPQTRLNELSDDPDDYKSGLVR